MPTELEELVGFIAHPNPQIRQVAVENLVSYSTSQPSIFKADGLQPVKNLKILVRDQRKIAENAITILVNISAETDVLELLAGDDQFLELVFFRVTHPEEQNANLLAMLLANMAKYDALKNILERKQTPPETLGSNDLVINQLVDLFVKGADGTYNPKADFDYLAYFFADLAKHPEARRYFVTRQEYDGVIPITKLKVFTEHKSDVRRKGVASTIKNVAFDIPSHPAFLSDEEIGILPYILLPIMGSEGYGEDDMLEMHPDLQLLPPDKQRDKDPNIVQTHVETLTLLTSTREGRELMRQIKVYPIIRETHAKVEDEGVQEACDRIVQVLMRDEEDTDGRVQEIEDDDDNKVVEV